MITKEMVCDGIRSGNVLFVVDPHMESGTVCKIGDYWFYFGGETAEEMQPAEYLRAVPMDDIVDEVYDTLEGFRMNREEFKDEYAYYEAYLIERAHAIMDFLS